MYADKTDMIYSLADQGGYYFLSRPRRFGKSLAISTMQAYFEGRKDLFEGLKIEQLEKRWNTYPVLHLDLNTAKYENREELTSVLNDTLCKWEKLYGTSESEKTLALRFKGVIERAYEKTGRQVVILVDEYDKPMLQSLGNEPLQNGMRTELKAFYSVMKTQDRYIRFAFLTGVTKFSKVSVFSDLNNLTDISLDARYERLCGIAADELEVYFKQSVSDIAEANGYTYGEAKAMLKKRYDGYHFSDGMTDMYNPFSLLNAFSKNRLGSYWFESGTPTFLVNLLRDNDISLQDLEDKEMDAESMGNVDVMFTNPTPVLYQSGYLTIKSYDREADLYTLSFPNEEVKGGFLKFLLPFYTSVNATDSASYINRLVVDIRKGDIEAFMLRLKSFFAGYNYELIPRHDLERHYQNVIFTVCKLIGLRVEAEMHTSNGRIDMAVQTSDAVYIFEMKLNVSAEAAIMQTKAKDYAAMFAADTRRIYRIGVNFSSEIRGIDTWTVE